MFITELSIKRPAFSWVLSLILVLFGTFVFWKITGERVTFWSPTSSGTNKC